MKLRLLLVALLVLPLAQAVYFTPSGSNYITDAAADFREFQNYSQGGWAYQSLRPLINEMSYSASFPQKWYDATCSAAPGSAYFQNYSILRIINLQPCVEGYNLTMNWTANFSGDLVILGWYKDAGGGFGGALNLSVTKNGQQFNWTQLGGAVSRNTTINTTVTVAAGDNVTFRFWNQGDQTGDYGNFSLSLYGQSNAPPQYQNATLARNSSFAGQAVNVSLGWTASSGLHSFVVGLDNGAGSFTNASIQRFAFGQSNYTFVLATAPGLIRYYIWANDSAGNGNTSEVYSFKTGIYSVPQFVNSSLAFNNSYGGVNTSFALTWNDSAGDLSQYIFSIDNGTGTFTNQSAKAFVAANNSAAIAYALINATNNSIVRWYWWASNNQSIGNTSEVYSLKTFASLSYNNATLSFNDSIVSRAVNLTLGGWTSSAGLSNYVIAVDNGVGSFTNQTPQFFGQVNKSQAVSTIVLTATPSAIVRWYWWVNDSGNNGVTSEIYSLKTQAVPFFNLTFIDEVSLVPISVSLTINNGTNVSTYSFSSVKYPREAFPTGTLSILASASGYHDRTFTVINSAVNLSNSTETLALINTSNASANTYLVSASSIPVIGARIDFVRNGVNAGSVTTTGGGLTGAVWLYTYGTYIYTASASGYPSVVQSTTGTSCVISTCVINLATTLNGSVGFDTNWTFYNWSLTPRAATFFTNTTISGLQVKTFVFTLNGVALENWGVNWSLGNGSVVGVFVGNASAGGSRSDSFNVTMFSSGNLTAVMWYQVNETWVYWNYSYRLLPIFRREASLPNLLNEVTPEENQALLGFLVIILAAAVGSAGVLAGTAAGAPLALIVLIIGALLGILSWSALILGAAAVGGLWLWRRPG